MNPKPRSNHRLYIEALRRMSPEERLSRAFELTRFSRELFIIGLHRRFPELSKEEIWKIYLQRLEKCHNRNW